MESALIDVRIFGVPERMSCILENQKRLNVPDDRIFIDERREGCLATARRAWTAPTDRPYTLVLQDDVELCDDFLAVCERMAAAHPDALFSLFPMCFNHWRKGNIPTVSPYISVRDISGQGILMRTDYAAPCIAAWNPKIKGDDVNIQRWAENNDIQKLTTIPCTMQHIGDVSVFDPSRSLGRSPYYRRDMSDVDWESTFITPWTNIVHR